MDSANDLSFEIARSALTQVGPDEVALLDALGLEFVEASCAPMKGDGALGFDVVQIGMAVAASSVAVAVKDYVVEVVSTYASDEGATQVRRLVDFFKRKRGVATANNDAPIELAEHEVAEVRRRAFAHARGLGLSEAKAQLLADAISGALHVEP